MHIEWPAQKAPLFFLSLLPALLVVPWTASAESEIAAGTTGVVRRIEIVSKRVLPAVIRKELAFKEGETLTPAAVEESKKNLHRLGLLKNLDIQADWDAGLNGYKVTVKAEDGWFLMPMPMFGSRGGEAFAGLMVMEKNLLRVSEGVMLFGSYSEGRASGMAGLFLPHLYLFGGDQESSLDEYQYADGGYNAKQFDSSLSNDQPEDFGAVTNRYHKDLSRAYALVGGKPWPWIRPSVGFVHSGVEYQDAQTSDPGDAGEYNAWTLSVDLGREGRADPARQGGMVAMGRIFGLGMAGVKDSLKPLPAAENTESLTVNLERGEEFLGSDAGYTKVLASASHGTLFRSRTAVALAFMGGWGDDLPPSQQFSTSQRGLLTGVYAREYRGDRVAAATASCTQPFLSNMLGQLNAEVFADGAWCWLDDQEWSKQGVGLNLVYRFWRVPLPFGGGVTYSFDDSNVEFAFAVGGMF